MMTDNNALEIDGAAVTDEMSRAGVYVLYNAPGIDLIHLDIGPDYLIRDILRAIFDTRPER